MAFIAAAVIGGGAALAGGYMASRSADKATKAASQADAAALAFEQQKYQDWQDTYGSIEDNLADYYSTLTPDYYEARGLEAFQTEQQAALENVRTTLAQRGIEDSGIAAATELAFAQEGAQQRAQIRATAPSLAAEEQRSFLQVGLGQDPGASYSRTLAESAAQKGRTAASAEAAAGKAVSKAITTAGTALKDYLRHSSTPDYTKVGPGSTGLGKYEV